MDDERPEAEAPRDPPPPGGAPELSAMAEATHPPEDWESRFKYLLADFENFRRRSERDRESIGRQARGAMLRELLPILEAFQSARNTVSRLPPGDPLRRGIELLDREWTKFLKQEGVEPVAEVGQPFRPDQEEAVGEAPVSAERPVGAVAEIVQQGYRYFGGLLRPAKVMVARSPASVREAPGSESAAAASEEKP